MLSRESLIVRSQGSLPFTPPHPFCVHVCSLSHQCRVLLLSLSHPFCVYVRSLSLSLRAYMVSHRAAQDGLPRSWCTPCPTGKLPAGWSKHQHADGGALYLRPDGRLVSEAPTWHETGLTGSEPPPLPGSTADEARCCCCYYYYCYFKTHKIVTFRGCIFSYICCIFNVLQKDRFYLTASTSTLALNHPPTPQMAKR